MTVVRWCAWGLAVMASMGSYCNAEPAAPEGGADPWPAGMACVHHTTSQMCLRVDVSDVQRRVQRVQQFLPVQPGKLTLHYPQWIPGNHAPTGPINQMAGLVFLVNGQRVDWQRDPVDMYAFHVDVPEGARTLMIQLDYLSPSAPDQGRVAMTPNLLSLQWHRVLLYPAGTDARTLSVSATLCLPEGWAAASALRGVREGQCEQYTPVDLMTLVDSPVYAGRYLRSFALDASSRQAVQLHAVAEYSSLLQPEPSVLAAHQALVAEADVLFGQRPFSHYDFLLALSDTFSGIGLEHAQSSENGMHEGYWQGEGPIADNDLLAHEYVHAWIGKVWRPEGSWVPHYNAPMDNRGLWIYEGLTQYWAWVLAARSGLWTQEQALARIAQLQASFAQQAGRRWRSLADTQYQGIIDFNDKPQAWADWQRGFDFYDESILVWLGADARLRSRSAGKRTLDAVTGAFHRPGRSDRIQPYAPDAFVAALESAVPAQWAAWLEERLQVRQSLEPDGLAQAGWALEWRDQPNVMVRDAEADGTTDLQFSLGVKLASDGRVRWIGWDSPAAEAGMARDMQVLAVNDHLFSPRRLKAAIAEARWQHQPLRLLVRQNETVKALTLPYYDGLRYPHLRRLADRPDYLTAILQPRRNKPVR